MSRNLLTIVALTARLAIVAVSLAAVTIGDRRTHDVRHVMPAGQSMRDSDMGH